MLKMALYSTVRSMKNVAVLTEDGAFALFFRPHPEEFDSLRVLIPGNLLSKAKKMLMPGDQPGGGGAGRSWNCKPWNTGKFLLMPCTASSSSSFFSQKNKNLFSLLSMLPSENNTSVPRRAKEKQAMNAGRPSPCFFLLS